MNSNQYRLNQQSYDFIDDNNTYFIFKNIPPIFGIGYNTFNIKISPLIEQVQLEIVDELNNVLPYNIVPDINDPYEQTISILVPRTIKSGIGIITIAGIIKSINNSIYTTTQINIDVDSYTTSPIKFKTTPIVSASIVEKNSRQILPQSHNVLTGVASYYNYNSISNNIDYNLYKQKYTNNLQIFDSGNYKIYNEHKFESKLYNPTNDIVHFDSNYKTDILQYNYGTYISLQSVSETITPDIINGIITFNIPENYLPNYPNSTIYSSSIIDIVDSSTLLVEFPYIVNNDTNQFIIESFEPTAYSLEFKKSALIESAPELIISGSFLQINLDNLDVYSGIISNVKVSAKNTSYNTEYVEIGNTKLSPTTLLVHDSNNLINDDAGNFYLLDKLLDEVWQMTPPASLPYAGISFSNSPMFNSLLLCDDIIPVNEFALVSPDINIQCYANNIYQLEFSILGDLYLSESIGHLEVYLQGDSFDATNEFGTLIGTFRLNDDTIRYDKIKIQCPAAYDGINNKLVFKIDSGKWFISNVKLYEINKYELYSNKKTIYIPLTNNLITSVYDIKIEFFNKNGLISNDTIEIPSLYIENIYSPNNPTTTYDTVFAGVYVKPTLTNNLDGTITLGSGSYYLYSTTAFDLPLSRYSITTNTTVSLVNNSINYITCQLISGSASIVSSTNRDNINQSSVIPVYTIYREDNDLHTLDWDNLAKGLPNKLTDRLVRTERFKPEEGGILLSEIPTRVINITSGVVWYGGTPQPIDASVSNVDICELYYHSGGNWTKSSVTQYNNTQYDNGTNLVTLTANRFAVNWIYRGVESDKHIYIVLGGGDYKIDEALASKAPTLPDIIRATAILVGRIIVLKSSDTAYAVQLAFDTQFGSTGTFPMIGNSGEILFRDTNAPYGYNTTSSMQYDSSSALLTLPKTKVGAGVDTPTKTLHVTGNMNFDTVANVSAAQLATLTLTNGGAGSIQAGKYYYSICYYTAEGDTGVVGQTYTAFPNITSATDFTVTIGNIPISNDPRVIGRKIYRSQAGTDGDFYYLYNIATITNNTQTTYVDNSPRNTTSTDWIYNKNNTTAGLIYKDGVIFGRLTDLVTGFGSNALINLTRGSTDTAFGVSALQNLTTGESNTGIGHNAGSFITTGVYNTAIGYAALLSNQTGNNNTAIGGDCLRNNNLQSYSGNTGVGIQCLGELTGSNDYNTGIGYRAGKGARGSFGVFIGMDAGYQSVSKRIGNYNTVIGPYAGSDLGTGTQNILIGYNVNLLNSSSNSQLNIGNVLYGTGLGIGSTPSAIGKIGIGTVTPAVTLDVVGRGTFGNISSSRSTFGNTLTVANEGGFDTSVFLWQYGKASGHVGFSSGSTVLRIVNATSDGSILNSSSINLTSTGNVGIGTSTPAYKLDIQGTSATDGINTNVGLNFTRVAAPIAPTYTLSAGGSVDTGSHYYAITYTTALGETNSGATLLATVTSGSNTVNLTIPTSSDARVTGRKIYRSKAGATNDATYYLATISDNSTVTYIDTAADSSLTGANFQSSRVNSTNRFITVDTAKTMMFDNNLTAIGLLAGNLLTSNNNYAPIRTTLVGAGAGQNITTGQANTIVGFAGSFLSVGSSNTLMGDLAGYPLTSGSGNSVFGAQAGRFLTVGGYNTIMGQDCARYLQDGTTQLTSATYGTYIGVGIRASQSNESNAIVIGYNAYGLGTNTAVIGNDSITKTILKGNVGIGGVINPLQKLHVSGSIYANTGDIYLDSTKSILWGNSNQGISATSDASIGFRTGGVNNRVVITNSGSVGIGTTAPNALLHVQGSSGISFRVSTTQTTGPTVGGAGIVAYADDGAAMESGHRLAYMLMGGAYDSASSIHNGAGIVAYATENWNSTNRGTKMIFEGTLLGTSTRIPFLVIEDGKVGIGTIAPSASLDVQGTARIGSGSNYTQFESDGTIKLVGSASVYNDIQFSISSGKTSAVNAPTWSDWNGLSEYQFRSTGDYIDLGSQEMSHDWMEGTPIEFHIHWSTGTLNYVSGNAIRWQLEYTIANMSSTEPYTAFPTPVAITAETRFDSTISPFSHVYSSFGSVDMTGKTIGCQVKLRLKRIARTLGTSDPESGPFALQVGLHYQIDTMGSRTTSAK